MEEKIIDAYTVQKLSIAKVAAQFGITADRVLSILKKNNIPRRSSSESHKLPVDSNFFHEINTEEKAYWLGFMYADGYVTNRTMGIKLQESDSSHLEMLKKR